MTTPTRDVLVGRSNELAVLRGALERAQAGEGRVVFVAGEPGVGKTRLSHELSGIALGAGLRVAWGRCVDGIGAPPLWPWHEVLRSLGLPADDMHAATDDESPQDRLRAFDAVFQALAASADGGLLVVLDDAHWADHASLLLLRFVAARAGERGVLLVVNVRDTEPDSQVPEVLAAVTGSPSVERLELRGLDLDAVTQHLALTMPSVDRSLAEVLHGATGGNPFFVSELAAAIDADAWQSGDVPPRSVREVVQARAARLTPRCRELVGLAAVAGREVRVDILAAAASTPVVECLPFLDEASAHGLVEQAGRTGRVRFVHALTRDAIVGSLDMATRLRHHRALAEAIEASADDAGDEHFAVLAEHWTALVPLAGPGPARQWTARAADAAVRRHAYEDAADLYRTAAGLGGADALERYHLDVALAHALFLGGDLAGAAAAARRASDAALEIGDARLVAEAALTIEAGTDLALNEAAREVCDRALVAGPDELDDALRARLLALRSHVAFYAHEEDEGRALGEDAMRLARASGDDWALIEALRARQESSPGPAGRAERKRVAEEMLAAAERVGSARSAMWGASWSIDTFVEVGDLDGAATRLTSLATAAERVGGPVAAWLHDRCAACIAAGRGEFDSAISVARRGFDRMRSIEPLAAAGAYLAVLVAVARHRGAVDDGTAMAQRPLAVPEWVATLARTGRAFLLARAGLVEGGSLEYELAGPVGSWRIPPFAPISALAVGTMAATALGRNDDVAELLARLEPYRGEHATTGAGVVNYLGPVELHLGAGALALGRTDVAVADLTTAAEIAERCHTAGFLADARHHLALALLARGRPADRPRIAELANASHRVIVGLGMHAFLAESTALCSRIGSSAATVLSPREEEVAALVAEGLTNRQIADRLVISERTAQNHVQHILTKLGFSARSQIAAWRIRSTG